MAFVVCVLAVFLQQERRKVGDTLENNEICLGRNRETVRCPKLMCFCHICYDFYSRVLHSEKRPAIIHLDTFFVDLSRELFNAYSHFSHSNTISRYTPFPLQIQFVKKKGTEKEEKKTSSPKKSCGEKLNRLFPTF